MNDVVAPQPKAQAATCPPPAIRNVIAVIIGLGTDIVEISRIAQMIERHQEHFLKRIFTEEEIRYCQRRKHFNEAFAGRWAAKEAVMKVLGTGFIKGIGWLDIEVLAERSGKPYVQMKGGAGDYARQIGIEELLVTISHCREYATATAIGVGGDGL